MIEYIFSLISLYAFLVLPAPPCTTDVDGLKTTIGISSSDTTSPLGIAPSKRKPFPNIKTIINETLT